MNMIIGFGTTETQFEEAEIAAFEDRVKERYIELGLTLMLPEFVNEIDEWLKTRGKISQDQSDKYRDAKSFPDRYSCFYPHIASSVSCIVAIFSFSHTNRRHAMSPDGWAGLSTERISHIFNYDLVKS